MDLLALLNQIDGAYAELELQGLCAQLGVDYRTLPGYAKRDKARELIGAMNRRGQVASLAAVVAAERPALATELMPLVRTLDGDLDWLDSSSTSAVAGNAVVSQAGAYAADGANAAVSVAMPTGTVTPALGADDPVALPFAPAPGRSDDHAMTDRRAVGGNPYTPGRPVAGAEMFVGRGGELRFLREAIDTGQHIALVGPRRMGKSSLLRQLAMELAGSDGRLVALIELSDQGNQEANALVRDAWRQLWNQVKPGPVPAVEGVAVFMTLVRRLNAAGFKPVLIVDDVEQIAWRPRTLGPELVEGLRSLASDRQAVLLVSASTPLSEVFPPTDASGSFAALFRQLDLALLDSESARTLLTRTAAAAEGAPPAADDLLELAGPHPFYLHLAGHYLANGSAQLPPSICFSAAAEPFFQDLWESLTPAAQSALLARTPPGNPLAARQLRLLTSRGVLIAEGDGYRPFSRAFATWLDRLSAAKIAMLGPAG